MFVILSKTLDLLLAPLTWALLLVAWALASLGARPRRARVLLGVAALGLALFSTEAVARRLFRLLERGAAATFRPDPPYDVAVILGGTVTASKGQLELNEASERILAAADLLRSGQAKHVLLAGGATFPRPFQTPEALVLQRWLLDQGIAGDRITVEAESRNTRENAVNAAPIVARNGWTRVLLVTSAWHAPRALGCFRAVGLSPDLLPVDHRGIGDPGFAWVPRARHLSDSTDALRELAGGVVYRLRGYSK